MTHFTIGSLLLRWLAALLGVFGTYNPSGYSYYHWVTGGAHAPGWGQGQAALQALTGVSLVIFYVVYLRATLRSLGPIGISLVTALMGSAAWLLAQWHMLDLARPDQRRITSLAITASVLAIGMSWSLMRAKISGQYDSEDVNAEPLV